MRLDALRAADLSTHSEPVDRLAKIQYYCEESVPAGENHVKRISSTDKLMYSVLGLEAISSSLALDNDVFVPKRSGQYRMYIFCSFS